MRPKKKDVRPGNIYTLSLNEKRFIDANFMSFYPLPSTPVNPMEKTYPVAVMRDTVVTVLEVSRHLPGGTGASPVVAFTDGSHVLGASLDFFTACVENV